MEFAVVNYFHISNAINWRCMLRTISTKATVELMVFPDPPVRSRMHIEIQEVIYFDTDGGWKGCLLNVATSEELSKFIPNLGSYLRETMTDEHILETYKLFVFPTSGNNQHFVARDAIIAQLLP
jgi:hypothetical protein